MVWTCEKRGRGGDIEDRGENAGDRKQTTGRTKGNVGTVSTEINEKERTKRGTGNGSKKLGKVDQRSTNNREKRKAGENDDNEIDVYECMGLCGNMCRHTHKKRDHRESNPCEKDNMDFKRK